MQDVVITRRGDRHRALHAFLTADVREIQRRGRGGQFGRPGRARGSGVDVGAVRLRSPTTSPRVRAAYTRTPRHRRGFRRVFGGDHHAPAHAVASGQQGQVDDPADRAQASVEGQLSGEHQVGVIVVPQLLPGPEADRSRSVSRRPDPVFWVSAGARPMRMRASGNPYPLFIIAERTRSADSLTAVSGRPTTVTLGQSGRGHVHFHLARGGLDALATQNSERGPAPPDINRTRVRPAHDIGFAGAGGQPTLPVSPGGSRPPGDKRRTSGQATDGSAPPRRCPAAGSGLNRKVGNGRWFCREG